MSVAASPPNATTTAKSERTELIVFRVADQDYCFDILSVREIRRWTPATVIPHAPPYVRGVINLRGAVVPIADLAARLGLDGPEPTARHVVIVAEIDGRTIGLLVDSVSDIIGIPSAAIQPAPDIVDDGTASFVAGLVTHEDTMIRLMNPMDVLPAGASA